MNSTTRRLLTFGLSALLASSPALASAIGGNVAAYIVTDLGAATTNRAGSSTALALTNDGAVVGAFTTSGGNIHAFLWQARRLTDLGTLGGPNSTALAVANVDGDLEVVGGADLSGNTAAHAFVWSQGTMTDLGTLPTLVASTTGSVATGINADGNIVGVSQTGLTLNHHAFLFTTNGTVGGGTFTDLGVFSGGNESAALGLGEDNTVIGESEGFNGTSDEFFIHAFLTGNANALVDLGTLDGVGNSTARAINDNRVIVGSSATASGNIHGFTYNATTDVYTDLGVLSGYNGSHAIAINSQGTVVGYCTGNFAAPDGEHAFVSFNGALTDLNSLIIGTGWVLHRAHAINDQGQIVGVGLNASGQEHAFLLTVNKPHITTQPLSVRVPRNGNVTLTVQASGVDLSYQWYKNANSITGATTANLTLLNVTTADQANYHVIVTNSAGSVLSADARVTVTGAALLPRAFAFPRVETVRDGATARFLAIAIGTRPLTLQWKKDGVNVIDGGGIYGNQSAVLTIQGASAGDAGNYSVFVTNSAGSVTSPNCLLQVRVPPGS